jgi:uncharacterized protein (TIGR04255 family)
MITPLGLEPVERESFTNPPVKTILAQVRFPAISDREGEASRDALSARYPKREWIAGDEPHWRMAADDGWAISLTAGSLALEANDPRHVTYDEVRARLLQACSLLTAPRPLAVALRYINHIRRDDPDCDWSRVVHPSLLGALARPQVLQALELSVNHWLFRVPAGILVLNHGLVRLGDDGALGYLLDFDCSTNPEGFADENVAVALDELHETIAPLFRWCLGADALAEFRRG